MQIQRFVLVCDGHLWTVFDTWTEQHTVQAPQFYIERSLAWSELDRAKQYCDDFGLNPLDATVQEAVLEVGKGG